MKLQVSVSPENVKNYRYHQCDYVMALEFILHITNNTSLSLSLAPTHNICTKDRLRRRPIKMPTKSLEFSTETRPSNPPTFLSRSRLIVHRAYIIWHLIKGRESIVVRCSNSLDYGAFHIFFCCCCSVNIVCVSTLPRWNL